jgi:murein L,D-transpeptidase YcbB/YkuD
LIKKIPGILRSSLEFAVDNNGVLADSTRLAHIVQLKMIYEKKQFTPIWSANQQWESLTDSLVDFIKHARLYGLFPSDYHGRAIDSIRSKISLDTSGKQAKRDAVAWADVDILLTDAFVHIVNDLKLGRLPKDSVTLRADSVLTDEFFYNRLALAQKYNSLTKIFHPLEPRHNGYLQLKAGIPAFLQNAEEEKAFTAVPSPKQKDPAFKSLLQKRLYEAGYITYDSIPADSLLLADAIKKFQKTEGITADGRVGEETVRIMNLTHEDRFIRIAISLDRYKLLPEKMPDRYVWVNLPAFYMEFRENDTLRLSSKIICGKPATRTPLLTSSISELVTYPQWTVPSSIIEKEILPAVKRNPEYLAKKGFSLVDPKTGDEVDPYAVDWSKYKKGIPYKVVQGSGDDNALGILKFNFPNKYAVYLHDTNQRYLFAQTNRSLSHGCVRVQDWEKLAYSIVRYDYKGYVAPSPVEDSMTTWLQRKEKHSIPVRNRLPVYIRYFTAEGKGDRIVFYDDIYGEDKLLQQRYFAGK